MIHHLLFDNDWETSSLHSMHARTWWSYQIKFPTLFVLQWEAIHHQLFPSRWQHLYFRASYRWIPRWKIPGKRKSAQKPQQGRRLPDRQRYFCGFRGADLQACLQSREVSFHSYTVYYSSLLMSSLLDWIQSFKPEGDAIYGSVLSDPLHVFWFFPRLKFNYWLQLRSIKQWHSVMHQ